jgi:hypothetical protein
MYVANIDLNRTLEKGRYIFELVMPARCLYISGSATDPTMTIYYRADIDRNFNNYTEIGKNGLISKSNNCSLYINDDVIQMVASIDGKGNAYGFKVTASGIYYKNGTNVWEKWNP